MTPPVALTIAGSDSGGGAGIQADLKTFAALGVHGCSAVAALTAQNTAEVRGVRPTPPGFLYRQIEAVVDDFTVRAVKTGMLATVDNIIAVADLADNGRLPNLVVDPVMVSSTGAPLLDEQAEQAYLTDLFPHAKVITPNCREAARLLGRTINDFDDEVEAAHELLERSGAEWVVIKGGDLRDTTEVIDIVVGHGQVIELTAPRIETVNTHGTGCSFAAATAAHLAHGDHSPVALEKAKQFVHRGLLAAAEWSLGGGQGPIDHFAAHASSTVGERECDDRHQR